MGMKTASTSHVAQPRVAPTIDEDIIKVRTAEGSLTFQDEHIEQFSRHCKSFYNSSLVLTSSSTSLDKNVGYAMSNDHKVLQGRIVIEALDRIGSLIAACEHCDRSDSMEVQRDAKDTLSRLRKEHELIAAVHKDLLDDCGLLHVDSFLYHGEHSLSAQEPNGSLRYEQYTQIRDALRRKSHKMAMMQRQSSLYELLSDNKHSNSSGDVTNSTQYLTRQKHVKHAMSTIEQFVRKYKENIGSHSFLAGLYRLIDNQLHPKSKTDIVQWNFKGSVLTEACQMNNEGDTEAYARDATHVLFSFLVINDADVEGGSVNIDANEDIQEPILSFQIDKFISDNNLRRILSVLPNPKHLDARATGSVEVFDDNCIEKVQARMNIDGHLDEAWPWWQELCNLL